MEHAITKLINIDPLWPQVLASVHAAVPETKAIVCYGSRVGGCANDDSDYDIIIVTAQQWPWSKQIRLEQDLSQVVGKDVDARVISAKGLRDLRLMDPHVHFALATGIIVGESEIVDGHAPLALNGILNMLENVELELEDLDLYEGQDTRIEQLRKCVRDLIVIGQILKGNYSTRTYHERINETLGNVDADDEQRLLQIVRNMLRVIKGHVGHMPVNNSDRYLEVIINS
ncbi:nucleotidyltransferase domain-containing protein [Desulfoscipio sp. XC116]|uniref:nucleotidyltransferase family protein n=1 Tax=Desulfoscipio sp. XC116 TaxID=3144975 RepID=UPI00325B8ECB